MKAEPGGGAGRRGAVRTEQDAPGAVRLIRRDLLFQDRRDQRFHDQPRTQQAQSRPVVVGVGEEPVTRLERLGLVRLAEKLRELGKEPGRARAPRLRLGHSAAQGHAQGAGAFGGAGGPPDRAVRCDTEGGVGGPPAQRAQGQTQVERALGGPAAGVRRGRRARHDGSGHDGPGHAGLAAAHRGARGAGGARAYQGVLVGWWGCSLQRRGRTHAAPSGPRRRPLPVRGGRPYWSEEKRTAAAGIRASHHTRTPDWSSLSAPTVAPSPITAPVRTVRAPTWAPRPIRESVTTAPASTVASARIALPEMRAPSPTVAFSQTTVPSVSFAPGATEAVGSVRLSPRPAGDGRGRRAPEDEVGGAAHEGLGGAQVQPVRGVDHALEVGAGREQVGERLAFHGDGAARRDRVDDRAAEHVGARVDLVGDDLLGRLGLLQEGLDPARRVRGDQAERPRVLDPGQVQGDVRAGGLVLVHQGTDVEAGEDVTVEDEDRVVGSRVEPGRDVADRAAGAEWLLLGDVLQMQSEARAVTEVRLEDLGEVRGGEHDVLDARSSRPGQLVGEERDARRRDHRLGCVHGERSQSGALAADQEDRFCHLSSLLPAGAGRTAFGLPVYADCGVRPGVSGPGDWPMWTGRCRACCRGGAPGTRSRSRPGAPRSRSVERSLPCGTDCHRPT